MDRQALPSTRGAIRSHEQAAASASLCSSGNGRKQRHDSGGSSTATSGGRGAASGGRAAVCRGGQPHQEQSPNVAGGWARKPSKADVCQPELILQRPRAQTLLPPQHLASLKQPATAMSMQVGGYQLHSIQGAIGGAKGVGSLAGGGAAAAAGAAAETKRKRDGAAGGAAAGGGGKELSKEDKEFLARREAARARVQQRTAASFGLT